MAPAEDAPRRIVVAVVYGKPGVLRGVEVELEPGATVRRAIERSGLLKRHPEIALGVNEVGIFGRPVPLDRLLRGGERVEIYRPLEADPKESRRRRAAVRAARGG